MNAPTSQDVHALIGQGNLIAAEAMAKSFTVHFPQDGFGWSALGAMLLQQGRTREALKPLRIAAALLPADAEVINNFACALQNEDCLPEAVAFGRRALLISPDFPQAHNNLGAALRKLGRLDESVDSLRRVLQIAPTYANAHFNLGLTLSDLCRFPEAASSFRRVLEIQPNHAAALVAVGNAEASAGKFADAERLYRHAIAVDPRMATAWSAITEVRRMTPDDGQWMSEAEWVAKTDLPAELASRLYFSIGKYCDDVRDFDRAFENYRNANELAKTLGKAYDPAEQTRLVDHLCATFSRVEMSRKREGASASARPVFIVGMPRSGTTLVEQIIAAHPDAFGAGELNYWQNAAAKNLSATQAWQPGEALLTELASDYLGILQDASGSAKRVVDKAPGNFINLGLIHTTFPNARILHLQRNPIDTCLSIYFQNFSAWHSYANDLHALAHYYREYRRMMTHWRAVLPPEVLLDVPYEALIDDQMAWSRRIIAFIGLEWQERCLLFQDVERRVGTASQWQVRQEIYRTSIDRWRNYEKFIGPLPGLVDSLLRP